MTPPYDNRQLSDISTEWRLFRLAHDTPQIEATEAQKRLLLRYWGAVHRYLLGALHDAPAAEELSQEFGFRFLRGDFQGADPSRGRFRDYLRTVLSRMVSRYHKERRTQPGSLSETILETTAAASEAADTGEDFVAIWRQKLLDCAWQGLALLEQTTGQPMHTVLQSRIDLGDVESFSAQMAEQLQAKFGRPFTAAGVRKLLQRAREKFAQFLLDEVEQSLANPTLEQLEQELRDLNFLAYCRPVLYQRGVRAAEREAQANSRMENEFELIAAWLKIGPPPRLRRYLSLSHKTLITSLVASAQGHFQIAAEFRPGHFFPFP